MGVLLSKTKQLAPSENSSPTETDSGASTIFLYTDPEDLAKREQRTFLQKSQHLRNTVMHNPVSVLSADVQTADTMPGALAILIRVHGEIVADTAVETPGSADNPKDVMRVWTQLSAGAVIGQPVDGYRYDAMMLEVVWNALRYRPLPRSILEFSRFLHYVLAMDRMAHGELVPRDAHLQHRVADRADNQTRIINKVYTISEAGSDMYDYVTTLTPLTNDKNEIILPAGVDITSYAPFIQYCRDTQFFTTTDVPSTSGRSYPKATGFTSMHLCQFLYSLGAKNLFVYDGSCNAMADILRGDGHHKPLRAATGFSSAAPMRANDDQNEASPDLTRDDISKMVSRTTPRSQYSKLSRKAGGKGVKRQRKKSSSSRQRPQQTKRRVYRRYRPSA